MLGRLWASVGLTQLAIWMIIIPVIITVTTMAMGACSKSWVESNGRNHPETPTGKSRCNANLLKELGSINWALILPVLLSFPGRLFYLLLLFAAVGSAVGDDMGDSQQLMMPLTIPVILAMVMIPAVFTNPNGPLAVFGSMFPLFHPSSCRPGCPLSHPVANCTPSIFLIAQESCFLPGWRKNIQSRYSDVWQKVTLKELGKWMFYKDWFEHHFFS